MENSQDITILAVPFPAQGHLNQLLHFSLQLSSRYSFSLHFASSPSHIRQARSRLQGWSSKSLENVEFHDLEIPPFETPPPDPNSRFPTHLIPSFYAALTLKNPLASLLKTLSTNARRLVVIHDPLMVFASKEASSLPNAESFMFHCVPSFEGLSHLLDFLPLAGGTDGAEIQKDVLDVIATRFDGSVPNEFWDFIGQLDFQGTKESGSLFNSCRSMDGDFLDLIAKVPSYQGKKLFTVGPLNPTTINREGSDRHEWLEWLDKQPQDSVVYVSFGSTSTVSDEQINQLATGLKTSGQRFIWVLRDADRGNVFANGEDRFPRKELPSGFEQEIEGVGMVMRGWAPQLDILAHPSTGAFMSHCGWNSCMESLSMGVPIIGWPMHSDQPRNAIMVTGYLKAGILVRDWSRCEEVISGEHIREVIRRMMVYDEGKAIRKRAKLIGEEARAAVSEGGSSKADLDSFIAHICR